MSIPRLRRSCARRNGTSSSRKTPSPARSPSSSLRAWRPRPTCTDGDDGQTVGIDADHRHWLETLLGACDRVAADVGDANPYFATLVADVEALRARLAAELEHAQAAE